MNKKRKPTTPMTTNRLLPHDVILEILSRVPAKSVLRFKCISKPFHNSLSNPNFIKMHANRAMEQGTVNLLLAAEPRPTMSRTGPFCLETQLYTLQGDSSFAQSVQIENPLDLQVEHGSKLLGSCNGLVCLCSQNLVSLLNPFTKEYKIVKFDKEFRLRRIANGLGYDEVKDDYVLVQIVDTKYDYLDDGDDDDDDADYDLVDDDDDDDDDADYDLVDCDADYDLVDDDDDDDDADYGLVDCDADYDVDDGDGELDDVDDGDYEFDDVYDVDDGNCESEVSVYSLKEASCFKIPNIPYKIRDGHGLGIYLNGYLHWVASKKSLSRKVIIAFHNGEKKFRDLPLPVNLREDASFTMGVLGGNVSILCDVYHAEIELWVMKRYGVANSWVKLFSIQKKILHRYSRALSFCEKGKVLLMTGDSQVLYYPKLKKLWNVKYSNISWPSIDRSVIHVASLVPLNTGTYVEAVSGVQPAKKRKQRAVWCALNYFLHFLCSIGNPFP